MNTHIFNAKKSALLGLLIGTTLISGTALAVDAVGGSARNSNVSVGAAWTVLTSVKFSNPTQRYCTATGSADVFRPTTVPGSYNYYFTVSDNPNPPLNQGQERTLEFLNQGNILDNRIKEITTTGGWMSNTMADPGYFTATASPILFGSRTLYFLARKAAVGIPNAIVDDASMTVTCTDNKLTPPLSIPIIPVTPVVVPIIPPIIDPITR